MHSEWRGWGVVIVIASHILYILQVGFTRCAGILFNSLQNAFLGTAAQTGAIISIMTSAAYFGCVIGGVLCNRYGCRSTAILGGVMQLMGMVASSICQTIQQMYIASFFIVFGIANMVGRLSSSIIVYKVPPSLVYSVAMLLASGAVLLGQFNSYVFFVLSVSTLGLCIGTVSITAMAITRRLVGAENMGSAIGFYQVLGGVGDLLGPIFAGALYDATEDYQVMFYIIAGIFFFCFLLTTLLPLLRKIEPGIDFKERGDTAVSNPMRRYGEENNPHSVPHQYSSLQSIQMTV
ncbi:uncharacterized protein [Asterias amurensis]|uniref:uncharacterized protein isoform X3 n=1 Tax=Asterias amurensis TaxID=7602 RepID=UPI003AB707F1